MITRKVKQALRNFVPVLHPVRWAIINAFCLLWSIYLLTLITFYPHDQESQYFVRENYYIYNLITCVVWVMEVGLEIIYYLDWLSVNPELELRVFQSQRSIQNISSIRSFDNGESLHNDEKFHVWKDGKICNKLHWTLVLELVIATYFLIDSMVLSAMMFRNMEREDEGLTADVVINVVAYSYISVRQYKESIEIMATSLPSSSSRSVESIDPGKFVLPPSFVVS